MLDLYSHRAEEAAFLKQLLANVPEIIVAADSSKLGRRHPWSFGGAILDGKSVLLVTDALTDTQQEELAALVERLKRKGTDRLEFCRATFGIEHGVAAGEHAAVALAEVTGGDFFDLVIDATGNAPSIERGFGYVAHGGTYVLVSVVKDAISFADPEFHKREMSLLGSRNALAEDFAEAVAGLRDGRIPSAALTTHRGALADLPELLPRWIDPASAVVKALVTV